jgi:beta-lactam-binding protein with PASTA domain
MPGRFALIIASSDYEDAGLRRLAAPTRDAEQLAAVLGDPAVGNFDVDIVVNRTSHEAQRRIEMFFTDRRRDDLLLLYFSGHGLKDPAGRLFLAMTNTERRLLQATSVPAGFVQEAMSATRSRSSVLLLDCCYGGAFARGMRAKGDDSAQVADRFAATGSVVLTASDALQYSYEDDEVTGRPAESVFTRALVEGLRTGAADRDRDGDIDLDELYDYVHDRVLDQRPEQRPGKWSWDLYGKIRIARNPQWTLPPRVRRALDAPVPALRLGAIEDLAPLWRNGNPGVVAVCREALEQLAGDDSRLVSSAAEAELARLGSSLPAVAEPVAAPAGGPGPAGAPEPGPAASPRTAPAPEAAGESRPAGAARPLPLVPGAVAGPAGTEPTGTGPAGTGPAGTGPVGPIGLIGGRPPRRSARRTWIAVSAVLAAALLAVGVVAGVRSGTRTVQVPAVGRDPVVATATLRAVGFTVSSVLTADGTVPAGRVIRTDPGSGRTVREHSGVTLYVSTGASQVRVPAVSGAAAAATAVLSKAGLAVKTAEEASATVLAGAVTRTVPAAGTAVAAGSTVTVYVSTGVPGGTAGPVVVPDVAGKPGLSAETALRKAGFTPERHYLYSVTVSPGLVIKTNPRAGNTARSGAPVKYYLSLGPDHSGTGSGSQTDPPCTACPDSPPDSDPTPETTAPPPPPPPTTPAG